MNQICQYSQKNKRLGTQKCTKSTKNDKKRLI